MSRQMSSKDICLALVYDPNKQTAELKWEPSCSIVSQLAVKHLASLFFFILLESYISNSGGTLRNKCDSSIHLRL
jgi:hypothetical protein